jgi:hypothetical protein
MAGRTDGQFDTKQFMADADEYRQRQRMKSRDFYLCMGYGDRSDIDRKFRGVSGITLLDVCRIADFCDLDVNRYILPFDNM